MRVLRSIVVLGLASVVVGCATPGTELTSRSTYYDDVDWVKMTRITREAEMRGHKVWWIHPPQKTAQQRAAESEGVQR